MGSKADAVRQRIIETADELFYQNGYDNTSFSDIAKVVNISRGNFYYHFKSKDDILDAVIKTRLQVIRDMLAEWDELYPDPRERLFRYIDIMTYQKKDIKQYGCPMGSLCTELSKIKHAMRDDAAQMMGLFREWLVTQFSQLGQEAEAENLAMHLLTVSQGVATMMTTFGDEAFYKNEIDSLKAWVDGLHGGN